MRKYACNNNCSAPGCVSPFAMGPCRMTPQRAPCRCSPVCTHCRPCPDPTPCPPCPTPVFPAVVCTPAFESFSDQLLQIPSTAVVIPNAVNASEGPAPYTALEAAFINLQLPLQELQFTPLGGSDYVLSSRVTPMVQLTYLDGNGAQRSKIVQAPMQLTGTVTSSVDPNTVTWWAFMENGSISSPAFSGTTLGFVATSAIDVIAIPSEPNNFPVLKDFACAQQPPVEAQCRTLYPLESYCLQSSIIPDSSSIPLAPQGPTPYTDTSATPLGGQPYVLRVIAQTADVSLIDLAFPILFRYTDGSGQLQTQATNLFMPLLVSGVASAPNARIIANLAVSGIIPSLSAAPPALTVQTVVLTGSIAAIEDKIQVLTIDSVQCGGPPTISCRPILPPPTMEITG